MDPSKSQKRYPLWLISYVFPQPGTSTTSSMHHSYPPIAKRTHTGPTTRGHLLTLSKEKRSTRSKGSLIIGLPEGLELSNTLSNGKNTWKRITPGNQLIKFTLHNLLTPITNSIRSKIKGSKLSQRKSFASSPTLHHVSQQIYQCQ